MPSRPEYQTEIIRELGIDPAPAALEEIIREALWEYGPDSHTDGYAVIAALAHQWLKMSQ